MGKIFQTPFVQLTITAAGIYASGDALGAKSSFPDVGNKGKIVGATVVDADPESANFEIILFRSDIAGTADNAAFAPTDAELQTYVGGVLIDTWKSFSSNAVGSTPPTFEYVPYWSPGGIFYFQCVTRATPTYTATTDILVSISVEN